MRTLASLLTITVFFATGCSDSPLITEYKAIVAETCACADAACATESDKKESSWRQKNYPTMSKDDKKAMGEARQGFTKCRDDLTK